MPSNPDPTRSDLPEEIAKAKGRFWTAARHYAWKESEENTQAVREASATLTAAILARLNAAEAERDEVARERDEARAANVAIAQQLIRFKGYRDAALARAERMEKAIRDFLTGDYPHPRSHRPGRCEHGVSYWEECARCDIAHFEAVLVTEKTDCS